MNDFNISRRNLLKSGVALAGTAAIGGALRPRRAMAADTTLRVLLAGDPFYYAIEGLKDQFEQETGIKVQIEAISLEALQARLTSSFVSNEPDADVISVDQMWLGQYLESKWIAPLNEMIKADSDVNIEDFIPEVLYSMNTWRGEVGTLPVAAYGQMVLYRKDFAEKHPEVVRAFAKVTLDAYAAYRQDPKAWLAMGDIFGDLAKNPAYVAAFSHALDTIWSIGTKATLEAYLGDRL